MGCESNGPQPTSLSTVVAPERTGCAAHSAATSRTISPTASVEVEPLAPKTSLMHHYTQGDYRSLQVVTSSYSPVVTASYYNSRRWVQVTKSPLPTVHERDVMILATTAHALLPRQLTTLPLLFTPSILEQEVKKATGVPRMA